MNQVTINLSDDSQMYDQFSYPAGEWQVRLKPETEAAIRHDSAVRIIARIKGPEDIIKLALLRSAVAPKGIGLSPYIQLVLPYLPYSRADRRFTDGDCAGLETFGSLIGSMGFDDVFTLDAHNREAAALAIPRLIDRDPTYFIDGSIMDFADRNRSRVVSILFPDEGARKRYFMPSELACNVGSIRLEVFHCHKRRNALTGALLGFEVPELPEWPALIIDDICDGGGTFIGIAKQTRCTTALGLYVSHGIFSKRLPPLLEHFSHIYTTNTITREDSVYRDALTVFDAMPELW